MSGTLKVPKERQAVFEGMRLTLEEVDEIKALRLEVESIKEGIESEHVNSCEDMIRVFAVALNRAKTAAELHR